MGVKMLQCFPFYRRCKERCKSRQCPPAPVPVEVKPRLSSTTSSGSDSEGALTPSRGSQIYFSTKARLSFRHQLDSNINAVDATY
uniref:Si:ch211-237l4.6 n=1 Tax=Nothobranchius korthausae TaxID=1143690 RepID=A0A1A8F3K2_9TELE